MQNDKSEDQNIKEEEEPKTNPLDHFPSTKAGEIAKHSNGTVFGNKHQISPSMGVPLPALPGMEEHPEIPPSSESNMLFPNGKLFGLFPRITDDAHDQV